jgi:hypothetical protein
MGGADPTITIPAVMLSLADANTVRSNLPGVFATIGLDLSLVAGTERTTGLMQLNAPQPVIPGSSISHYEPVAFRNQLMEPGINNDLTHSVEPPEDLTNPLMIDVGWFPDSDGVPDGVDACIGSDTSAVLLIDGCDTGATNLVDENGCRFSDFVEDCAEDARNHGGFTSCVSHLANEWKKQGLIGNNQHGKIQKCASHGGS